jgi:hypothetical protein
MLHACGSHQPLAAGLDAARLERCDFDLGAFLVRRVTDTTLTAFACQAP